MNNVILKREKSDILIRAAQIIDPEAFNEAGSGDYYLPVAENASWSERLTRKRDPSFITSVTERLSLKSRRATALTKAEELWAM